MCMFLQGLEKGAQLIPMHQCVASCFHLLCVISSMSSAVIEFDTTVDSLQMAHLNHQAMQRHGHQTLHGSDGLTHHLQRHVIADLVEQCVAKCYEKPPHCGASRAIVLVPSAFVK